jgi:hypothetical protein
VPSPSAEVAHPSRLRGQRTIAAHLSRRVGCAHQSDAGGAPILHRPPSGWRAQPTLQPLPPPRAAAQSAPLAGNSRIRTPRLSASPIPSTSPGSLLKRCLERMALRQCHSCLELCEGSTSTRVSMIREFQTPFQQAARSGRTPSASSTLLPYPAMLRAAAEFYRAGSTGRFPSKQQRHPRGRRAHNRSKGLCTPHAPRCNTCV